jgi:inosose dehydratase
LADHGLQAVGGFTPLLLHLPGHDPVPEVDRILDGYVASGAQVLVLSAVTGDAGYDTRPQLDEARWKRLLSNLDRVAKRAADRGVRAVLHPHVGTMIETGDEVQQVLSGSSISLCLDTGHLLIGGTDPAELARQAPERIAHLHLKDVDSTVAAKVQSGQLTYSDAVKQGMYRPLGQGDIDVSAIVGYVRAHGYSGWYTLEQDTILTEKPKDEGPVTDVWTSAEYLRTVLAQPAHALR